MAVVSESLKGRHFTRVADWSGDELLRVLDLADDLKERQQRREEHELLPGRALGMIFQKPSTRTRVSFEVGIAQLGGHGLYLAASDLQLGRGETLRDTATVLSRYLDGLMIRTFVQEDVEELARHASIPVINGLTDSSHPCQALADFGIDGQLVRLAGEKAIVLHCLPAHYGEEITEGVLYGPQSAVWDQAENRLHAQKGLLALVMP